MSVSLAIVPRSDPAPSVSLEVASDPARTRDFLAWLLAEEAAARARKVEAA
jgi:hypothetical protein